LQSRPPEPHALAIIFVFISKLDSGGFSVAQPQLNLSFNLTQRETLGAIGAQPEILNCFMFCVKIFCVEAKKSASIQTHQRLGALRIGTLRDHESVAAASYFRSRSFALCRPQSQAAESIGGQMPLTALNRMLK
jgi:hypothetical protein